MSYLNEYKKVYKTYDKKLKQMHTLNFKDRTNNMDYFITYLKFMRDHYILTGNYLINGEENVVVAALATAIYEYELSLACLYDFYKLGPHGLEKAIDGTEEEILVQYNKVRSSHLNRFWGIVSKNMENWLNDITI